MKIGTRVLYCGEPGTVTASICKGSRVGVVLDGHLDGCWIDAAEVTAINTDDVWINDLCVRTHVANAKWWLDLETGLPRIRNVGELLMLTVSELAEAMEGHRKGLMDDKLPHRKMFEVELADTLVRLFDIGGGMKLDLGGAYAEKMNYNAVREDHKIEVRKLNGGKKY